MKLKTVVTSLALQQIKHIGRVAKHEHISMAQDIECTCKIQWYIILMLGFSIFGLVVFVILKSRKLKFSQDTCSHPFISDTQYYVPTKLSRMEGNIHLFKIKGMLTPENVKLNRNIFLDIIELDWKEVNQNYKVQR